MKNYEKENPLVDAPVSGGEAGAKSGKLSIMVGGDKSAYLKIRFILSILGSKITYLGKVDQVKFAKLAIKSWWHKLSNLLVKLSLLQRSQI